MPLPWGGLLIALLADMTSPPSQGWSINGIQLPRHVAIGPEVDPTGRAAGALSRFGAGLVVVGPARTLAEAAEGGANLRGRSPPITPVAALVEAASPEDQRALNDAVRRWADLVIGGPKPDGLMITAATPAEGCSLVHDARAAQGSRC